MNGTGAQVIERNFIAIIISSLLITICYILTDILGQIQAGFTLINILIAGTH